mmetsp:Transcript_9143/g.41575  ORF Transcript_9143/g.41575 Transcript_9143/m.41575 type:complete len:302 (-) Transcript_9143:2528-3433(-)
MQRLDRGAGHLRGTLGDGSSDPLKVPLQLFIEPVEFRHGVEVCSEQPPDARKRERLGLVPLLALGVSAVVHHQLDLLPVQLADLRRGLLLLARTRRRGPDVVHQRKQNIENSHPPNSSRELVAVRHQSGRERATRAVSNLWAGVHRRLTHRREQRDHLTLRERLFTDPRVGHLSTEIIGEGPLQRNGRHGGVDLPALRRESSDRGDDLTRYVVGQPLYVVLHDHLHAVERGNDAGAAALRHGPQRAKHRSPRAADTLAPVYDGHQSLQRGEPGFGVDGVRDERVHRAQNRDFEPGLALGRE